MGSRKPRPGGKPKPPENEEVIVNLEMVDANEIKLTFTGDPDDVFSLLSEEAALQFKQAVQEKYGDVSLVPPE